MSDAYRAIPLRGGGEAIVDADLHDYLSQWKWSHHKTGYVIRYVYDRNHEQPVRMVRMHRVVNNTPDGVITDHVNGNTLDNRRCNLRDATVAENQRNKKRTIRNRSGYKGVFWSKHLEKWKAALVADGKEVHLGVFDDPVLAAKAYNDAARQYFGEFARLNELPPEVEALPPHVKRIRGQSRFKGVRYSSGVKKRPWFVLVVIDGKPRRFGTYASELEAAMAYNREALSLFGSAAELNVIPETSA